MSSSCWRICWAYGYVVCLNSVGHYLEVSITASPSGSRSCPKPVFMASSSHENERVKMCLFPAERALWMCWVTWICRIKNSRGLGLYTYNINEWKYIKWILFWTTNKYRKVEMILAFVNNRSCLKTTWKIQARPGIEPWPLTGCIAKVMVRFSVKPESFFRFFFNRSLRLFIQLRGSFPLKYTYKYRVGWSGD